MRIKVNGVHLGYAEIGEGERCFFLHGNRDRKEVFLPLVSKLLQGRRLMFMDYRGHGESDVCDDGFHYHQFVKDINGVLKYSKGEKINLIGHSLGGVLSILYSLQYPKKVNRIILLGTCSHFVPKFQRPEGEEKITAKMIEKTNNEAKRFFFLPKYEEVEKKILNNWSLLPPYTHKKMIEMGHVDLRDKLSMLKCKVLIINGEKDSICGRQEAQFMKNEIRNAKLVTIPGTAHYMFMEKPKETARAINSFLKE